jgi:hypothetical protein
MAGGWMPEKYFWRSGREKCFSLDIPSPETDLRLGLHELQPELRRLLLK